MHSSTTLLTTVPMPNRIMIKKYSSHWHVTSPGSTGIPSRQDCSHLPMVNLKKAQVRLSIVTSVPTCGLEFDGVVALIGGWLIMQDYYLQRRLLEPRLIGT